VSRVVDREAAADIDPYQSDLPLPRPSGRVVEGKGDRVVDVSKSATPTHQTVRTNQVLEGSVRPRVDPAREIGDENGVAVSSQPAGQILDERGDALKWREQHDHGIGSDAIRSGKVSLGEPSAGGHSEVAIEDLDCPLMLENRQTTSWLATRM